MYSKPFSSFIILRIMNVATVFEILSSFVIIRRHKGIISVCKRNFIPKGNSVFLFYDKNK